MQCEEESTNVLTIDKISIMWDTLSKIKELKKHIETVKYTPSEDIISAIDALVLLADKDYQNACRLYSVSPLKPITES